MHKLSIKRQQSSFRNVINTTKAKEKQGRARRAKPLSLLVKPAPSVVYLLVDVVAESAFTLSLHSTEFLFIEALDSTKHGIWPVSVLQDKRAPKGKIFYSSYHRNVYLYETKTNHISYFQN